MQNADIAMYVLLGMAGAILAGCAFQYQKDSKSAVSTIPNVEVSSGVTFQAQYPYIDQNSHVALEDIFRRYNALAGLPVFLAAVKPVVAMERGEVVPHVPQQTALSRAGGNPDLPPDAAWPRNSKNEPLLFLHQVNLKDVASVSQHAENLLPKSGLLLFFYDYDNQPWGFDPKDRGGWKVMYVPEEKLSTLVHRQSEYTFQEDRPSEFPLKRKMSDVRPLTFSESYSMPTTERLDRTEIGFPSDREFLYEFLENMHGRSPGAYFFGHPTLVQGDVMQREAQMASNGVYGGSLRDEDNEKYQQLLPGVQDWVLLFQDATDFQKGHEFGDTGTLYFWIMKQDAAQGNFDNVWAILQSA